MIGLTDRLPPQNLEAERGVLGSVILSNDMMHEVGTLLVADDFYRDSHAILWSVIVDLYRDGKQFDALILSEELSRVGKLTEIGGDDAIVDIVESVPHASNALMYAHYVRQKSLARRLLAMHEESIREIYSNTFTAEQLIDRAQSALLNVVDHAANARNGLKTVKSAMGRAMDVIDAKRQGAIVGVSSGIKQLDDMVTFMPGSFTVVGARPGMGKSALALNFAVNAARCLEVPVLMFSMEMIDSEIGERLFSQLGCASGYHMRHPRDCDDDDFQRLVSQIGRAREIGDNLPIYIDDTPGRTSMQVISIARRARIKHGIGFVIVDYLQLCEPDDERDNRQEQVSKISRRLKNLARSIEVPVMALSQLNRQCEAREDRRPRKSDLRESGSLEQDADNVLLLYCPDEQSEEAEIIVDKNRSGPMGTVKVRFHRNLVRFEPRSEVIPEATF